jgi:hypothetical protein
MKRFFMILVALIGFGISVSAQSGTEMRDAGKVLKSRTAYVTDPYTELNQILLPDRTLVIKIELVEMGNGRRYTVRTVQGYQATSTGNKVNEFDNNSLLFYQRIYGGKFSDLIYDNRPNSRDTRI